MTQYDSKCMTADWANTVATGVAGAVGVIAQEIVIGSQKGG